MGDDGEQGNGGDGGEKASPSALAVSGGNTVAAPSRGRLRAPWAPGQSGNPAGSTKLARELRQHIAGPLGEKTREDIDAIRALATSAKNERVRFDARTWLVEQVIGRAAQPLTDSDGKPLQITNVIVLPAEQPIEPVAVADTTTSDGGEEGDGNAE